MKLWKGKSQITKNLRECVTLCLELFEKPRNSNATTQKLLYNRPIPTDIITLPHECRRRPTKLNTPLQEVIPHCS